MSKTQLMCHFVKPHALPQEISAFIYIYIDVDWLIDRLYCQQKISLLIQFFS